MNLTKEIVVFVLLVVATMLSFFCVFCMYFPLRKTLVNYTHLKEGASYFNDTACNKG